MTTSAEEGRAGPIGILHLEDDPADGLLVAEVLAEGGIVARIDRVSTWGEFRAGIERGEHALILADYTIPGMDALEALRFARSARPGVPYIFVSGTLGEERAVEILRQGATDYVLKHRLERLVPAVRNTLEEVRERRLREQAEELLRENAQRLRAMFENVALGISQLDPEFRFLEVNQCLCRLLGYRRDELLRMTAHEITAPEDRPRSREVNDRLREGGLQVTEWEKRYLRSDGSPVWVRVIDSAVRDEQGRLSHVIGTVEDISERRQAAERVRQLNESLERRNAELREADRRKDEFIALLSHELRNPLAPIQNGLDILDRVPPASENARHARAIIGRQVKHLTRLVGDLLDVSRITRGKVQVQLQRLDLCEVVSRTIQDHASLFAERGLELRVDRPGGAIWTDADETRLTQALGNLLQNAAKFTPRGGRVLVRTRVEGSSAVVSVRDSGVGIPAELMPRLFEPFMQADRSLARSAGGLGLGLALARSLIELQKGELRGESEGAGRGAEFTIRLPVEAEPVRRERAPAWAAGPNGRRVLVVEDNVDAAESLKTLLEMMGHQVQVAHTGPEGVARARELVPDVVLCDIGLPGMDGNAVARALRADPALRRKHLIALSGYASEEDIQRSRAAGFDRHLAKPPSFEALERMLAEVSAGSMARQAAGDQNAW